MEKGKNLVMLSAGPMCQIYPWVEPGKDSTRNTWEEMSVETQGNTLYFPTLRNFIEIG